MLGRLGILALCLVSSTAALADASVNLEIKNGLNDTIVPGANPLSFSNSVVQGAGSASGSADMSSGVLKAKAVGPGGSETDGLQYYSFAVSEIKDNITFSPGATGTAYLDYHWDGTLSPSDGVAYSQIDMQLYLDLPGSPIAIDQGHFLTNGDCYRFNVTSCADGVTINQTGTIAFAIEPGMTFLQIAVEAEGDFGQTADLSNTGSVYLRLPAGVTFTSDSGVFLSTAMPVLAVPEPAPAALLLAGLGVIGFALKRVPPSRR